MMIVLYFYLGFINLPNLIHSAHAGQQGVFNLSGKVKARPLVFEFTQDKNFNNKSMTNLIVSGSKTSSEYTIFKKLDIKRNIIFVTVSSN
jgi:hypothetical protein